MLAMNSLLIQIAPRAHGELLRILVPLILAKPEMYGVSALTFQIYDTLLNLSSEVSLFINISSREIAGWCSEEVGKLRSRRRLTRRGHDSVLLAWDRGRSRKRL